jgi:hypothetical protein
MYGKREYSQQCANMYVRCSAQRHRKITIINGQGITMYLVVFDSVHDVATWEMACSPDGTVAQTFPRSNTPDALDVLVPVPEQIRHKAAL